jgi:hypothetical protein
MDLIKECNKAITYEIAKQFRKEAKEIIKLTTDKFRQDLIDYHNKDQGNICCLILDAAKRDLVDEGKMTFKEGDGFGKPLDINFK